MKRRARSDILELFNRRFRSQFIAEVQFSDSACAGTLPFPVNLGHGTFLIGEIMMEHTGS